MPVVTVEGTFGVRTLTTYIRTLDTTAQDNFFQSLFKKGQKLITEGRKAFWDEQRMSRNMAPVIGLTSPAPKSAVTTRQERDSAMMLVKVSRDLAWDRLFFDRAPGSLRPNARMVIEGELADMRLELGKTKEYACCQALQTGGLIVNATNIPGSDQSFTLDYTVNTYTKTNSWNNAATQIWSQEIPLLLANTVSASAIPAKQLIVNDVTARGVLANTELQKFGATANLAKEFLGQSAVPSLGSAGLLDSVKVGGLDMWIDAYGYDNGSGFTKWVPDNYGIALPADPLLPQVLGWASGKHPVPKNLWGPAGDIGFDMMGPGPVAWAKSIDEPMMVQLFLAEYFLPVVMFPEAATYAQLS